MQTSPSAAACVALLGRALGGALGVPVEFQPRAARLQDPVADMCAYGTELLADA